MKFVLSNIYAPCPWAKGRDLTVEEANELLALELRERRRTMGTWEDRGFHMRVVREKRESTSPPSHAMELGTAGALSF